MMRVGVVCRKVTGDGCRVAARLDGGVQIVFLPVSDRGWQTRGHVLDVVMVTAEAKSVVGFADTMENVMPAMRTGVVA
ncbi:MAG: hypothetical protein LBV06_07065 [Propionibacteriaceae bacterium]|jgi:hypothetical protein|nr:hypothetical protein [Propionibacteriaceae bacterium]